MALACNKKYRHGELTRHDLLAELESWGLRRAEKLLTETMDEIADAIATETPLTGAAPNLQDQLAAFARNLQNGRPVGGEVSKGT
jgi:serine/threonine-protein kinase HipA